MFIESRDLPASVCGDQYIIFNPDPSEIEVFNYFIIPDKLVKKIL